MSRSSEAFMRMREQEPSVEPPTSECDYCPIDWMECRTKCPYGTNNVKEQENETTEVTEKEDQ